MVMGVDPHKMAEIQSVSRHIKGAIRVDYKTNQVIISLSSSEPAAAAMIPSLLDNFSGALAQQLSSFFAIEGEITEVGKPES